MRKCKLNSEQFSKKFSCYRTAVNSRSRYEHRIYLKRLGIEPNSKQARKCSRSTKTRRQSNSDDDEPSTITVKKTVSFSDQITQDIPPAFDENGDESNSTSPIVISSKIDRPSLASGSNQRDQLPSSKPRKSSPKIHHETSPILEPPTELSVSSTTREASAESNYTLTTSTITPALSPILASQSDNMSASSGPFLVPPSQTNSIKNYFKVTSRTVFASDK
jgi:hypothetical protein